MRSFPSPHGADIGNDNELVSSKDLNCRIDSHSQSAKVLENIHLYLFTVDAERKGGSRQMLTATWPEEQLSAENPLRIREGLIGATFVWRISSLEYSNPPYGNCSEDNGPTCVPEIVQAIEKLAHRYGLQPELDVVLAELRVLQVVCVEKRLLHFIF
ncbi:MAG: hypothetical protein BYD32DRAFT_439430 [Podila humilis]|nr:MAG: hypothetical protein BYD32DRAFT_439430 [Podila humilis]